MHLILETGLLATLEALYWRMPDVDLELNKSVPDKLGWEGFSHYSMGKSALRRYRRILRIRNKMINWHSSNSASLYGGNLHPRLLCVDNLPAYVARHKILEKHFYEAADSFMAHRNGLASIRYYLKKQHLKFSSKMQFKIRLELAPTGGVFPVPVDYKYQLGYQASFDELMARGMGYFVNSVSGALSWFANSFDRREVFGTQYPSERIVPVLRGRNLWKVRSVLPVAKASNFARDPDYAKILEKIEGGICQIRTEKVQSEQVWALVKAEAEELCQELDPIRARYF